MRSFNRISQYLLATVAMLAVSLSAFAYEVHVLNGQGSESKAMNDGNYELAIERLERRVAVDTKFSDIQLTNLCTAYVATGQLYKADDVCDQAVEAKGEFVGIAFNSRGVLKALQGDYIAAMNDFERAQDESNYPFPRSVWGEKAPSMRRFDSVETELINSTELAARNFAAADQTWASIREEGPEALRAGVK